MSIPEERVRLGPDVDVAAGERLPPKTSVEVLDGVSTMLLRGLKDVKTDLSNIRVKNRE